MTGLSYLRPEVRQAVDDLDWDQRIGKLWPDLEGRYAVVRSELVRLADENAKLQGEVSARTSPSPDGSDYRALLSELKTLQHHYAENGAVIRACEPYLKDGEHPAECIERWRKDALAVTGLLAAEKHRSESALAAARGEYERFRESAKGSAATLAEAAVVLAKQRDAARGELEAWKQAVAECDAVDCYKDDGMPFQRCYAVKDNIPLRAARIAAELSGRAGEKGYPDDDNASDHKRAQAREADK